MLPETAGQIAHTPPFRIFVSSPGDVVLEREIVKRVTAELNDSSLLQGVAKFQVVAWEDAPVPLSATLTPQEALSQGFYRPSECDVVVVILWSRMGTPLPDHFRKANGTTYLSGVEWEYEDAYTASPRPDILLFRRTELPRLDPSDPNLQEKLDQFRRVEQFLARFRTGDGLLVGAFNEYETPSDFEVRLRQALVLLVSRRVDDIKKAEAHAQTVMRSSVSSTVREWVFISYSHADAVWLERLKIHMAPLVRQGVVDCWEDTQIRPGSDWRDEIMKAIAKARAAVLLLSADFLASDFITTDELPPLLEAAREDGAVILPVIVSPCRFLKTPSLARFQSVNPPATPLIAMSRAESEAMLVKVTDALEEALA